jgi:hypothetical protein
VLVNSCVGMSRVASVLTNRLHTIANLIMNKMCTLVNPP